MPLRHRGVAQADIDPRRGEVIRHLSCGSVTDERQQISTPITRRCTLESAAGAPRARSRACAAPRGSGVPWRYRFASTGCVHKIRRGHDLGDWSALAGTGSRASGDAKCERRPGTWCSGRVARCGYQRRACQPESRERLGDVKRSGRGWASIWASDAPHRPASRRRGRHDCHSIRAEDPSLRLRCHIQDLECPEWKLSAGDHVLYR